MRIVAGLALISALANGSDHDSKQLNWLVGCWVSADKNAQEVWVVDSDQSLIGFNIVFRDNKVRFYELQSIKRDKEDSLVYTAHPSGQQTTSFAATEVAENSVVFTNPDGANPNSFDKVACD